MRRVRTSTWVLTAVFLVTLVLYFRVRPPSPAAGAGACHVTANHHAEANLADHANESGVPDRHPTPDRDSDDTPDRDSDDIALLDGDANSLRHGLGVPIDESRLLFRRRPSGG